MNRRKLIGSIPLVLCAPAIVRAQSLMELGAGSVAAVAAAGGIPQSGLIAQWIMDLAHVSGVNITDSKGTNTGSASAGVSPGTASGPGSHSATSFDGVTSGGIVLTSLPLNWSTVAFSIGGWANITNNAVLGSGGANQTYFGSCYGGGALGIRLRNDTSNAGSVTIGYGGGGTGFTTPAGVMSNTTWKHMFITNDGSGGGGSLAVNNIYINAVSQSLSAGSAATQGATASVIGGTDTGTGVFGGALYNWLIYNRAVSGAEVLQIFNAQ